VRGLGRVGMLLHHFQLFHRCWVVGKV
jgi:hypothetical protein